jgi:protein tyrosine phosphatase (PTP) superfamily phosphohydrolase (DUF442 family)
VSAVPVETIVNFIRIDDRTATGGQPTTEQLEGAREAGIRQVINLAPHDVDGALPGEAALVTGLGMAYHHIAVPWDAPEAAHLARFGAVMDAIGEAPVLIHCQANYRVTAFYAAYAVHRLGWSEADAHALIDRIWTLRPDSKCRRCGGRSSSDRSLSRHSRSARDSSCSVPAGPACCRRNPPA